MKGLWKKDWYLMKELKKTLILMMLLVLFILFTELNNMIFVLNYMTILSSMMVINTFALDEQKNGNAFLFTLPFSRKTYVTEKYLFGMILGIIGWGLTIAAAFAVSMIKQTDLKWGNLGLQGIVAFGVFIVMLGIAIPIQIKFGAEKGRIVLIAGVLAVSFAGAGIMSFLQGEKREQMMDQMQWILRQKWIGAAVGAGIVCLFVISILYSIHLIEKKEY